MRLNVIVVPVRVNLPLSLSLSLSSLPSSGVPGEPIIPVESKEDIFDIINYPYKKPEERSV